MKAAVIPSQDMFLEPKSLFHLSTIDSMKSVIVIERLVDESIRLAETSISIEDLVLDIQDLDIHLSRIYNNDNITQDRGSYIDFLFSQAIKMHNARSLIRSIILSE